jgi:hypothetical protein
MIFTQRRNERNGSKIMGRFYFSEIQWINDFYKNPIGTSRCVRCVAA